MVAQLGKCSPASLKWLGLSLCPLLSQAVRALTVMLHRQWLTVRRAGGRRTPQQKQTVRCLRDTVLLLHSLSQKDKLFTVHCVEVLHQYDQVMPGVSMLIRALPDVTDCEGKPVLACVPTPLCLRFMKIDSFAGLQWVAPVARAIPGTADITSCSGSLSILGCPLIMSIELA